VELAALHEGDRGSIWVEKATDDALDALPPAREVAYRWGQGFHTRGADGLYYCEVLTGAPSNDGLIRVRTLPELGDNTRGEEPREGVVEARYVWPLLRGEAVHRLSFVRPTTYCLVPHDPEDLRSPLSAVELAEKVPRLFDFLEPWIERLAGRSAYDLDLSEETPFAIQGAFEHLSPHEPYVVSRYIAPGGTPPAAPVFPEFDGRLGRATVPYFNNKSNFLRVESPEEAWFIATFINVPASQQLIGRVAMSTTISPMKLASVPIPRFDPTDDAHRRLVELGRGAVEVDAWEASLNEINTLVLTIGGDLLAQEAPVA